MSERTEAEKNAKPVDMVLKCPKCGHLHIDKPKPEAGWHNPPHATHLCHKCGNKWKPFEYNTNGVESGEIPGHALNDGCPLHPEKPSVQVEQKPQPAFGSGTACAKWVELKASDLTEAKPKKPHPFLAADLFERCHLCKGSLKIAVGAVSDGMNCPECTDPRNTHAGYCLIGMTVGQLERLKAEQEKLLDLVYTIAQTDPGATLSRVCLEAIVENAAEVLKLVNRSDVTAARMRFERDKSKKTSG